MTALPTTTEAFASGATEAQFKTFLSSQRSFLAGLLGTDGTAATARATLGVNDGVTSVNGNTGAITAEQIAAAATAGYGYTPANTTHAHSNYVSTNMTHGAVGSLCFARADTSTSDIDVSPGGALAGSRLMATSVKKNNSGAVSLSSYQGALPGTWICLGSLSLYVPTKEYGATLWQRIS